MPALGLKITRATVEVEGIDAHAVVGWIHHNYSQVSATSMIKGIGIGPKHLGGQDTDLTNLLSDLNENLEFIKSREEFWFQEGQKSLRV